MRCLRQLTNEQLKASIFLSKENYDTLDDELRKNYNMEISDFGKSPNTNKKCIDSSCTSATTEAIKMKRLWARIFLDREKSIVESVNFRLDELDESKYEAKMYEKGSLRLDFPRKKLISTQ